jgi:hypothetical protein
MDRAEEGVREPSALEERVVAALCSMRNKGDLVK